MYKKIIVISVLLLIYNLTIACDLCSIYIGINPNDYKNSVGFRHQYRAFKKDYVFESSGKLGGIQKLKEQIGVKHGVNTDHNITNGGNFTYRETYNSYDIFANVFFGQRLQLNISSYFSDNYIFNNDSIVDNVSGIGDLTLLLKYQLVNSKKSSDTIINNKLLHRLIIGGGINLPIGSFNDYSTIGYETRVESNMEIIEAIKELDPHIQAGTGGFSYLIIAEYLAKYNKMGINTNISYRINTTNKNDFRFANRFNANGSLFFLTNVSKNIKFMPNMGTSFEASNRDQLNDQNFLGSGGKALFLNGGFNLFVKNLSLEFSYYHPVYENLLDDQPFNHNRIITQMSYYF